MSSPKSLRTLSPLVILAFAVGMAACQADDNRTAEAARMPPEQFLDQVRQPFRQDAWAKMSGSVTRSDPTGKTKAHIRAAVLFAMDTTHARVILNDENAYALTQVHRPGAGVSEAEFELPEVETGTTLEQLGVRTSDVTFSFLDWPFSRELAPESVGGKMCRVLELIHPKTKERAWTWFSIAYYFPLRVHWFHDGADAPWRQLELKGLKRHSGGLWFIKDLHLKGQGWKTQVRFSDAELDLSVNRPPPADLLTDTPKKKKEAPMKRRVLKVTGGTNVPHTHTPTNGKARP